MSSPTLPIDVREAAIELRNDPDSEFSGEERPADVIYELLNDEIVALQESREKASEKQDELASRMGVSRNENGEAELSEAEQRQEELKERFGHGQ